MNKKYIFLASIGVAFVLLILAVIGQVFRIERTIPGKTSLSKNSPFIDIQYSKKLSAKGISVTSPDLRVDGFAIEAEKSLRVFVSKIPDESTVRITIKGISSTSGKMMKDTTLEFKTNARTFDQMPQLQKDLILEAQDRSTSKDTDPLLRATPYGGLNYEIKPVYVNDVLTIETKILLSNIDVRTNRDQAVEAYKKESLDYLRSKSVDPTKYKISYKVVEPSLY